MSSYRIDTEEGQGLELELAGLGSRAAAGAIDLFLCLSVVLCAVFLLRALTRVDPTFASDFVLSLFIGGGVALPLLWQISFSLRGVQTPGKYCLGLRVIDRTGAPAKARQCLLRAMLLPLELIPTPLPIGLIAIFAHPKSRRLGDLVAGTLVVRDRDRPVGTWAPNQALRAINGEQLASYKSEITPARLARLKASERALLRDLQSRRGLRAHVRFDLEAQLAGHFARRFQLPVPKSPRPFLAAIAKALSQQQTPSS